MFKCSSKAVCVCVCVCVPKAKKKGDFPHCDKAS